MPKLKTVSVTYLGPADLYEDAARGISVSAGETISVPEDVAAALVALSGYREVVLNGEVVRRIAPSPHEAQFVLASNGDSPSEAPVAAPGPDNAQELNDE